MSEVEVIQPAQIALSKTPKVFHVHMRSGSVVCVFHPGSKMGGVVQMRAGTENFLILQNLVKGLMGFSGAKEEDFIYKVVSDAENIERARALVQKLKVPISGEYLKKTDALEAFFYSDTGRLRIRENEPEVPQTPPKESFVETPQKKVLVVDDSKSIRQLLTRILGSDPRLQIIAEAEKPSEVEALIEKFKPDVITLDIHMPEMDGVQLLKKIYPKYKIPTVMITSLRMEDGPQVLEALESGAVDYIQKPSLNELDEVGPQMIEKVFMAAGSKRAAPVSRARGVVIDSGSASFGNQLIAIGSSTGGTEAIRHFLSLLPPNIPPILIVQHIPPVFSTAFAQRLAMLCPFEVKEAQDGDIVKNNRVLIAPGGFHMKIEREKRSGELTVRVIDTAPVNRHKPSVDVLFDSVAELLTKRAIGVLLTGMGADGARGLLKMKQAGAPTIAQNEATCVVYGMPRAAVEMGAADHVLGLDEIPQKIWSLLQRAGSMAAGSK